MTARYTTSSKPLYHEGVLVPALTDIQKRFGYLERDELKKLSEKSEIPLHAINAVASFFPHFRLTPPAKVSVRVCRDMACHLAGSADILAKLDSLNGRQIEIKGA